MLISQVDSYDLKLVFTNNFVIGSRVDIKVTSQTRTDEIMPFRTNCWATGGKTPIVLPVICTNRCRDGFT